MKNFSGTKTGSYIYIVILLIFCIFSDNVWAKKQVPKVTRSMSNEKAAQLLLVASKWDELYDRDRKIDVTYLLGGIDGKIFEGLDKGQRQRVRSLMQAKAIEQMEQYRLYFKKYLVDQYVQFFTLDEIVTLTKYFNTEVVQMGISAKLDNSMAEYNLKDKLIHTKDQDKKSIDAFSSSYLYTRYFRFQEKVKKALDKMIIEKLKIALDNVIASAPEFIEQIKNNSLDIKDSSGHK